MPKSPTDKRHFIIAAALVAIGAVLLNWLLKAALPLPVQASIEAQTIDQLIGWHLTLISVLFSLVVVIMLYSVVVFRRRDGDEEEGQHFEGNTTLEIVWTVVPLIVVVVFAYIGVVTLRDITQADPNEVAVKVTGFQWAWSFEYPDGSIDSELVLPLGRQVRLEMTATDVIHSFWVPEMRVKQDLVPGQVTVLRLTPSEIGEYAVRCAELCGMTHWSMVAPVRVVEPEEFEAWISREGPQAVPALVQASSSKVGE